MVSTVICHTKDCENEGVPIELELGYTDDDGAVHETATVICGPCGNPITDIAEEE